MIPHQGHQASELVTREFGGTARLGLRLKCRFAAIMILGKPGIDRAEIDIQRLRQFFRLGPVYNQLYDAKAQGFCARTGQFSAISIAFAFHKSQYNIDGFTLLILNIWCRGCKIKYSVMVDPFHLLLRFIWLSQPGKLITNICLDVCFIDIDYY